MHLPRQQIIGESALSSSVLVMRRLGAIAILIGVLAGAASALSTPQVNTYGGTTSGGARVIFWIDTHTAHTFSVDGHTLFSNAQLEQNVAADGTATWRFHTHSEHWRVHGHWVGHTTVHGSICNLAASPSGCPHGEHLQTYVAEAKTKK
jgi:hypothetical protein